jgi:hypothetical protein
VTIISGSFEEICWLRRMDFQAERKAEKLEDIWNPGKRRERKTILLLQSIKEK